MAGQPRRRARRAAGELCAVPGCTRGPAPGTGTCQRHANWTRVEGQAPLPPDARVVALAGAVLLGRYRGTIAASGQPLQTSLAVLDEQLPTWVERVQRQLGEG